MSENRSSAALPRQDAAREPVRVILRDGCDAVQVPWQIGSAFSYVRDEVVRQDETHPKGFDSSRDGVRFGIATVEDELRETLRAWDEEKRSGDWRHTREELTQTLAVGMRLLRCLHDHAGPSID